MILIGHNGAGKSTLISYLLRFYTHPSQHPFIKNFQKFIAPLQGQKIGYAPESALLDLSLNAWDYFKMIAALQGVQNFDIDTHLAQVKLSVDPKMALLHYSKGMRQRLLLALALLGNPDVLVLDEPTSGLDPFGQEAIESLLLSLKEKYRFIISTHSLKLAQQMDDEIWIIKEGEIVHQGRFETVETLHSTFMQYQPEILQ